MRCIVRVVQGCMVSSEQDKGTDKSKVNDVNTELNATWLLQQLACLPQRIQSPVGSGV